MKRLLQRLANNRDADSLAVALRRKRFRLLESFLLELTPPVTILDIGGVQRFWEQMGYAGKVDFQITLLNIIPQATAYPNLHFITGDACNLPDFGRRPFDIAFSNSVIEHLGSFDRQQRMAEGIKRVGKSYFIQTPNRYFPLEPHFLVPFFQFFPLAVQIFLLRSFDLGWYRRIPDYNQARQHILSHRLLTAKELRALFPGGALYREKLFGLTKSFIAYHFAR